MPHACVCVCVQDALANGTRCPVGRTRRLERWWPSLAPRPSCTCLGKMVSCQKTVLCHFELMLKKNQNAFASATGDDLKNLQEIIATARPSVWRPFPRCGGWRYKLFVSQSTRWTSSITAISWCPSSFDPLRPPLPPPFISHQPPPPLRVSSVSVFNFPARWLMLTPCKANIQYKCNSYTNYLCRSIISNSWNLTSGVKLLPTLFLWTVRQSLPLNVSNYRPASCQHLAWPTVVAASVGGLTSLHQPAASAGAG